MRPGVKKAGLAVGVLVLLVIVTLLREAPVSIWRAVVEPFVVPGAAMVPTVAAGDRVLASKVAMRIERGAVVVFDDPSGESPHLIKRVVAFGGETVDLHDGLVWVDGKRLDEPCVGGQPTWPTPGGQSFPMVIPQGSVLVLGDNRTNSADGRLFGPVPVASITARVFAVYWPLAHVRAM